MEPVQKNENDVCSEEEFDESFSEKSQDNEPALVFPESHTHDDEVEEIDHHQQSIEDGQEVLPVVTENEHNEYFNHLLRDQQDFLRSLETAENQMMFDENFMMLVSGIANKNPEKIFTMDYRDPMLQSRLLFN